MNNYLAIIKQEKKREALQKSEFNKISANYRELFKCLLENHCNNDRFLNLLLFQKCNIENCRIFGNETEFYDTIQSKVKFFHKIYQFEISKRAIPAPGLSFEIFYLSTFAQIYNTEIFDFDVKGYLYIVLLYHSIKKEVQIVIYNGLLKTNFEELANNLGKLQSERRYATSTLCYK